MDKQYLRSDQQSARIVQAKAMNKINQIPDSCIPDRQYLQKFILPHLQVALRVTAEKRPKDPVQFFSYYLLAQRKK